MTRILLFIALLLISAPQITNAQQSSVDVAGSVSVTDDGISTIPSLSLGKPAALFNLSVGKRFRFEPEFRFPLEGEPWSFLFWFRYDLLRKEKFSVRLEAHPALSFKTVPALIDEVERDAIEARRFLAGDLTTTYRLSNNVSVGTYYLYSHGFDPTVPSNTHYLSLYSSITNLSFQGCVPEHQVSDLLFALLSTQTGAQNAPIFPKGELAPNVNHTGNVWLNHSSEADIHEVSVNIIDNTAFLLNRITLRAGVGGNEVTNPFKVTEVYVKQTMTGSSG